MSIAGPAIHRAHGRAAGGDFGRILAKIFRAAGGRPCRSATARNPGIDFVFDAKDRKYVVDLKVASEGRRDRLIPLLAQAILQVREFARNFPEPAVPIAVVAARQIPPSVAAQIHQFAQRYAPEIGVGVIDSEGLRSFAGAGVEGLAAKPPRRAAPRIAPSKRAPDLFSGLNQWMLKILLGQALTESLLSVPRERIRNASQLAALARVSVMSATRLVNQLRSEGFVDKREDFLHIVRTDELLERWRSANRPMSQDIPAHWIIKKDEKQFLAGVARYAAESQADSKLPRCALGLFAAAAALGFEFVRGVPPHLYIERLDLDVLQKLGLSMEDSGRWTDVYLRVPAHKESVFRAAVLRDGLPVSDVLQVWLDVSAHPARGREQSDHIWRRVLKPLFGKRR